MTETFKPYEPEDPSGYEYDEYAYEESRGGRILWGRVALLGVGLLIAFFLGRMTAGGSDEGELKDLRAELSAAKEENEQLQQDLTAAQAAVEPVETPGTTPTDGATDDPAEEEPEPQTYTVRRGDTLRGIAQTFCGDPSLDDLIAAENGIADATELSVGEELILPADCTA